jgi:hypothetical protein
MADDDKQASESLPNDRHPSTLSIEGLSRFAEKVGAFVKAFASLTNLPSLKAVSTRLQTTRSKGADDENQSAERHDSPLDVLVVNWPQPLLNPPKLQQAADFTEKPINPLLFAELGEAPGGDDNSNEQPRTKRKIPSAGKGFLAGAGKVASAALYVLGPFGKLAGAAIAAASYLDKFSAEQVKAMQKLATYSPAMSAVFAQRETQEITREMRVGGALSKSAKKLTDAEQRAKTAEEPFDIWWAEKKNAVARTWYNFKADMFEAGNSLFGAADKDKNGNVNGEAPGQLEMMQQANRLHAQTGKSIDKILKLLETAKDIDKEGAWTFGDLVDAMSADAGDAAKRAAKRVEQMKRGK